MGKSGVFDSTFFSSPKAVLFANWTLIPWSCFVQKLLSRFELCISIIVFPAYWYTSLYISQYNISIRSSRAATTDSSITKLHVTLLVVPRLL